MGYLNREKILQPTDFNNTYLQKMSLDNKESNLEFVKYTQPSQKETPQLRFVSSNKLSKPGVSTDYKSSKTEFDEVISGHSGVRAAFKKPGMINSGSKSRPFQYFGRSKPDSAYQNNENSERSMVILGDTDGFEEKSGVSMIWAESDSISNNDIRQTVD